MTIEVNFKHRVEVRPMREEDWERVRAMTAQAFLLSSFRLEHIHGPALEEGRVVSCGGRIQGVLRIERVGQFFGGQSVPSAVIAGVAVLPEARGKGVGRILMREVLSELRSQGTAISTLFPTSVGFYRALGYEFAGAFTHFGLPIAAAPRKGDSPTVEPWMEGELSDVMDCYRRFAQRTSGLVDRPESWWKRRILAAPVDRPVYRYLVRKERRVTGYIIYSEDPEFSPRPFSYSLVCRDLIWEDAASARAFLLFIASHPVLGVNVLWPGPTDEPLSAFIETQDIQVNYSSRWMTRILDLTKALEARAYPTPVKAEVELAITDPILPENQGSIRLEVSHGKGKMTHIGSARVRVDIGALTAMYTGWLAARDALRAGRLQAASEEQVEILEAIFSGPKPWVMDQF